MAEGTENSIPNVVSIAGVDPSGGAGVLADVKAMSACGAYACGVIAALTAQNTQTVTGVMPVPATFLKEQIDTLFDDVRIDAVKIGMLGTVEQIETVADALVRRKPRFVVLDPVMVAKGGSRLLAADAVDALKERLLPLATIITPNLPEAMCLLGREEDVTEEEFPEVARELWKLLGVETPGSISRPAILRASPPTTCSSTTSSRFPSRLPAYRRRTRTARAARFRPPSRPSCRSRSTCPRPAAAPRST